MAEDTQQTSTAAPQLAPAYRGALCSAVLVLKDGQVEEAEMLNDLLRTPRSEMLTAFRAQLSSAVLHP